MPRTAGDASKLAYELAGEGPSLVLIHGLGGSPVLWSEMRESLLSDHRLLIVDRRNGADPGGELTLERWAGELRALIEELGLEHPVLVGHSLGSSIALAYALRHAADVRALVLMSADANIATLRPRMERSAQLISDVGFERWVAEHWSRNSPLSAESVERAPWALERYRDMLLSNDPDDYVRNCLAIAAAEDLSERVGELQVPTLVLAGTDDDRTPAGHGVALAGLMPNAVVKALPGVGHTPPLEAPDAVVATIRAFLEDR